MVHKRDHDYDSFFSLEVPDMMYEFRSKTSAVPRPKMTKLTPESDIVLQTCLYKIIYGCKHKALITKTLDDR